MNVANPALIEESGVLLNRLRINHGQIKNRRF